MHYPWFRHSNGMSTDATLTFIAQKAGARRCEMTAFWDCLLEHASAHTNRGYVGDIDLEQIAVTQQIDLVTIQALHALLVTKGRVTQEGYLKHWNRYNDVTKKQPLTSAERVRKHRENKKKLAQSAQMELDPDVTRCNESNDVTTYNTTRHLKEKNSPLPPPPVDNSGGGVLKNEGGKRLTPFRIEHLLSDAGLEAAKAAAPGWDVYVLMRTYDEGVNSGKREPPSHPDKAFPAWIPSYTKGKRP